MVHVNYIEGLQEIITEYSNRVQVYKVYYKKDEYSYWRSKRFFPPKKCYKCGKYNPIFVGARVGKQITTIKGEIRNRFYIAPICKECAENNSLDNVEFFIPRLFLTLPPL